MPWPVVELNLHAEHTVLMPRFEFANPPKATDVFCQAEALASAATRRSIRQPCITRPCNQSSFVSGPSNSPASLFPSSQAGPPGKVP